jgi:asparagine synthase (glutamine-hydrolysing)
MCGFAGFIDFHSSKPQPLSHITQMGEQLWRRGPDDEQVIDSPPLSFVFRRLSIVDIAGGQQPIWNEDNTLFVAVNGEIYNHLELRTQLRNNHHFRTHSDAEIVLHLYEEFGSAALSYVNGMFAIILWDDKRQQLFLARDRLGIKPLYYTQVGSQLIFGSTLYSVLVHPDTPWLPQFQDLTNLSVTTSYVRGINRLAGGHYLLFDADTQIAQPQCYWNLADYLVTKPVKDSRTVEDYIREYRTLFVDSVKKCLMSDVPVGACLSGGLDSGVVVAVASQFQPDLHCFSIEDENTRENGDIQAARQFCEHLKLPFHPLFIDSEKFLDQIDFSLETFEYFIWIIDSPRFSVEWVYKHELHRYAKTLMPDLKVMLLGQGSDEFAGGYSAPQDRPSNDWHDYNQILTKQQQESLQFKRPTGIKDGSHMFERSLKSYPQDCTDFQKEMLMRIYTLQDYNLWHEDRSSMSQSIEARVPFLDHRLVEYLASIPPQHHPTLFWNKTIIRKVAEEWLPQDFVYRQKSHANEPQSYNRIKEKIIQRVFPRFQQKYIDNPQLRLFKPETLLNWFEQASSKTGEGTFVLNQLLNAISMTIFKQLCRQRKPTTPSDYLYGRSAFFQ